ncbi:MAG TPA: DUF6249 domain-containing protein [Chthoniobacterales bacterium]|nr:DUF6249 domain-containing protein [Chthoniobacterales bacterium]
MKTLLVTSLCALSLSAGLWAQTTPATPAAPAPPAAVASPVISPTASPESSLEQSIRNKHKNRFHFVIGKEDTNGTEADRRHHGDDDDIPAMVVPLVGVVFLTIFGAPVLIVAVILYFGFSKSRMQHRTIRMMVEKGQPVPAELLAPPPPAQRQRSDMRRGVVLVMIGVGLMLFFAAVNDWEGGAWAIGVIPFLIGLGYLLVWKLEGKNGVPPPPPVA